MDMVYPTWLEEWWISRAMHRTRTPSRDACMARIERDVARLSDLFTVQRRRGFGGYADDPRALIAYGLFFFPQTYVRVQYPLIELFRYRHAPWPEDETLRVLDLGAGLGAASFGVVAALRALGWRRTVAVTGVDRSNTSLTWFAQTVEACTMHLADVIWQWRVGDLRTPARWHRGDDARYHLIVISFALDEAFHNEPIVRVLHWIRDLRRWLASPGWVLIVEPAMRSTSAQLEHIRDRVVEDTGWYIWGPCPHHHRCPLRAEGTYWCHEVRAWSPPRSLEVLNRKLWRSIQVLKFSFLILGTDPPPRLPEDFTCFRLVAPVARTKGKIVTAGCAGDGHRYTYEWLVRDLSRDDIRWLLRMERGDILTIDRDAWVPVHGGWRAQGAVAVHKHFSPRETVPCTICPRH